MRTLLLLFLVQISLYAADINITNIPTAGGSSTADKVLGLTNGTHTVLIPISQIVGLVSNITGNAATATTATNLAGPIDSLSIGTLTVTNPPVLDGSLITNLSSGSFRFSTPSVTSGATNWIVDLAAGKGVYKTITATNDITFLYCTNGPGVCSIKIYPNGADRLICVPTNWMAYSTNNWAVLGTYWSRILTNAPGTIGPRVMTLSVRNETASTQTNTDWGFLVTVP